MYHFLAFVFFTSLLKFIHGEFLCPSTPSTAKVFLDLEQLGPIATQPNTLIESPKTCTRPSSCDNQICCTDEVGCCYMESITGKRLCGCKGPDDLRCIRSAPLVVLKNSMCEPHKRAAISMCLRTRVGGGWQSPAEMTERTNLIPEKETKDDEYLVEVPLGDTLLVAGEAIYDMNSKQASLFLKKFTAKQLVEKLEPSILSEILDIAETNKAAFKLGNK